MEETLRMLYQSKPLEPGKYDYLNTVNPLTQHFATPPERAYTW